MLGTKHGGDNMIRKLILPAVAIALLGGCMTGGYSYRQDRGDYYYGQSRADYGYYGSPYGYPSYGYGYPGYSGYLGYSYGFGSFGYPYQPYPRYYTYPYRPYPYYRPPVVVVPRPGVKPPRHDRDDRRRPPWRDLDNRGRHRGESTPPQSQPVPMLQSPVPARPAVRPRDEGGSRNERLIPPARGEPREIE